MSAEIILVGAAKMTDEKLKISLSTLGLSASIVGFKDIAEALEKNTSCTTLIFNLETSNSDQDFAICSKIVDTIKNNANTCDIRILGIGISNHLMKSSIPSQFDDLLFGTPRIPAILARVVAFQRLKTMRTELIRRNAIAEKYGFETPAPSILSEEEEKNTSILLTGRPNGFARIEATLSKNATLNVALSLEAALEYLERENYDTLIINAGVSPTRYLEFVSNIRQNPALYNLPILLIANPTKLSDSHIAYSAGVTDIIDAPVNQKELIIRINALIEEKRFRGSMGKAYEEARHYPTHDALTGLYAHGFFHEHLNQLISDSIKAYRPFSLITIELENLKSINEQFGYSYGDSILRQVSEILMRIVRGEDLAARYSGRFFIITLPDTNANHAENVVKRIEGIVQKTEFICSSGSKPITVELNAEVIESRGETNSNQILKRSHQLNKRNSADRAA